MTITQTAKEVTLTGSDGRTRTFKTDGSKVRDETAPGGGAADVKASWSQEGGLVVTVKPEKGPNRTEIWTVSNDRKRLYLTFDMDGGPRPPRRLAYDAAPPAAKKPAKPK